MARDTPNHKYNRPSKGATDWHRPINENFSLIDRDVEVRDVEDNLGEYTPTENSKFLATDTGSVYLGDGDSWQPYAAHNTYEDGFIRMADGTLIARPGEIQAAIDSAATGSEFGNRPTQTIRLISGQNYETSDTIVLKPGSRLECNGARIVPDGNFNVFELHRESQLVAPHIDTQNISWDATQVVIGAPESDKLEANNRAWVIDAYLLGEPGRGIGLQFRGDNGPCSMQVANGNINGFDRAIEFYAAGGDTSGQGDWSNGNQFYGRIRNYRIGVSMRSEGAAVSGNTIRIQAQSNSRRSEWLWWMKDDPRESRDTDTYVMNGNTVIAYPWDISNYNRNNEYYSSDLRGAPIWYIGRGTRYGNSMFDLSGLLGNEYIVNNSDFPNRNGIFTAHGGDVTGVEDFFVEPAYRQNSSRAWHPESRHYQNN